MKELRGANTSVYVRLELKIWMKHKTGWAFFQLKAIARLVKETAIRDVFISRRSSIILLHLLKRSMPGLCRERERESISVIIVLIESSQSSRSYRKETNWSFASQREKVVNHSDITYIYLLNQWLWFGSSFVKIEFIMPFCSGLESPSPSFWAMWPSPWPLFCFYIFVYKKDTHELPGKVIISHTQKHTPFFIDFSESSGAIRSGRRKTKTNRKSRGALGHCEASHRLCWSRRARREQSAGSVNEVRMQLGPLETRYVMKSEKRLWNKGWKQGVFCH